MADHFGSGQLPHGSRILMEHVPHSRAFSLGFFFPTGSRSDPVGKAGLAHLVEHLVFKGTKSYSTSELARMVDRVGGDLNAWTDREELAFSCTVPCEHWETAAKALMELCFFPRFPEQELEREKEVIRNEILATFEDAEEMSYDTFLEHLDPGLWSRPIAGTPESLSSLTLSDVKLWHRENVTPSHLVIVACGAFDSGALQNRLSAGLQMVVPTQPTDFRAEFSPARFCRVVAADFQMVQVIGGWSFPSPKSLREAIVWQVFSMLWGETMSSRLFQSLREELGLCYSVGSQIFDTDQDWGLQFFATSAPEHGKAVVEALREQVKILIAQPPTEEEWEDSRQALKGGMLLSAEKMEARVSRLWRYFQSFHVQESLEASMEALDHPVTSDEKQNVLQTLVHRRPVLLVWGKTRLRSSRALEALWDL